MELHPGGRTRHLLGASAVLLLATATGPGPGPGDLRAASHGPARALAATASRQVRRIDPAARAAEKEPPSTKRGRLEGWLANRWERLQDLIVQAEGELAAAEARDELFRAYRVRQAELELRLRNFEEKSVHGRDDPKAEASRKELARIEELIRQRRAELLKEQLMRFRAFSEERRRRLECLAKELKAETARLHLKAKYLAVGGLDLEEYNREVEAIEELVNRVSRKVKALQAELDQVPPPARELKGGNVEGDR